MLSSSAWEKKKSLSLSLSLFLSRMIIAFFDSFIYCRNQSSSHRPAGLVGFVPLLARKENENEKKTKNRNDPLGLTL